MTANSKLEQTFGKIEQSAFLETGKDWRAQMPWKKHAQQIALEVLEHLNVNHITQKKFSEMMGVKPQLVNKWLKGNENFTLETISRMEKVLSISLMKIITHSEENKPVFKLIKGETSSYEKPHNKKDGSEWQSKLITWNQSYNQFSKAQ